MMNKASLGWRFCSLQHCWCSTMPLCDRRTVTLSQLIFALALLWDSCNIRQYFCLTMLCSNEGIAISSVLLYKVSFFSWDVYSPYEFSFNDVLKGQSNCSCSKIDFYSVLVQVQFLSLSISMINVALFLWRNFKLQQYCWPGAIVNYSSIDV
jgi:hypothetical protein